MTTLHTCQTWKMENGKREMREYKVRGRLHPVYEELDELPQEIVVSSDWRNAEIGDWIRADDGCVLQVLRKGSIKRLGKVSYYIGTCTGTFPDGPNVRMDTERRDHIYSFGGRKVKDTIRDRERLTKHEVLFARYIVAGLSLEESYMKAFPTNQFNYAKGMAANLFKTERIQTQVKEELKPVLEELGIDNKTVLKDIRDVSQTAEKEDVRLRALFKLSDILDLEDKNQTRITQVSGALFQGFSSEALEEAQRPELTEVKK